MKNIKKEKGEQLPSAADDCADVKSKYDKFKKITVIIKLLKTFRSKEKLLILNNILLL